VCFFFGPFYQVKKKRPDDENDDDYAFFDFASRGGGELFFERPLKFAFFVCAPPPLFVLDERTLFSFFFVDANASSFFLAPRITTRECNTTTLCSNLSLSLSLSVIVARREKREKDKRRRKSGLVSSNDDDDKNDDAFCAKRRTEATVGTRGEFLDHNATTPRETLSRRGGTLENPKGPPKR
jgi:hypothetical protein